MVVILEAAQESQLFRLKRRLVFEQIIPGGLPRLRILCVIKLDCVANGLPAGAACIKKIDDGLSPLQGFVNMLTGGSTSDVSPRINPARRQTGDYCNSVPLCQQAGLHRSGSPLPRPSSERRAALKPILTGLQLRGSSSLSV